MNASVLMGGHIGGATIPDNTPVASFTVSNLTPSVGDTIYFTDTSTNVPTSWSWFINGVLFSSIQNPSFYCANQGFPVFKLTAANTAGSTDFSQGVDILPQI